MQDSADIKAAADRLQSALASLDAALTPLVETVDRLEAEAAQAGDFNADRADLARRLDESEAAMAEREKAFAAREAEFEALAQDSTRELDRVIRQVKTILEAGH